MIPVSLKLKGIYSYQDKEQTIDFQNLTAAGLFGIFGSVGSGKSTILEAISFALYGETERLNKQDKRGYNMMNLKSDELLIDFIFKNGKNDDQYRFIVKAKRNSKQFNDVKSINREAFKLDNNQWIPISADSTEQITGLNYLNFRRTVIIPQGKFQEFLQLGDTERTKMMKELFHLERFDLSEKTRIVEDKNNEKLTSIQGQLLQLSDVSAARVPDIEKELENIRIQLVDFNNKLKEKQLVVENLKLTKELFSKIENEEKEYVILLNQKPEIELIVNKIRVYQDCIFKFKNLISNISECDSKTVKLQKELKNYKLQFDKINLELQKIEKVFDELKIRYQGKEKLMEEAQNLEKIIKLKDFAGEISHLELRMQNGLKVQNETTDKIKKLDVATSEVKSKISEIKANLPDIKKLMEIKNWFFQCNSLKNDIENIDKEIFKLKQTEHKHQEEVVGIGNRLGFESNQIDFEGLKTWIAEKKESIENEVETLDDELKHLKVKTELSRYSESLVEGDACPVCGSTHHPEKMQKQDLSDKSKALNQLITKLKNNLNEINILEKDIVAKLIENKHIKEKLNELADKQKNVIINMQMLENSFPGEKHITENELAQELKVATVQSDTLSELENEWKILEDKLKIENQNREKYQLEINKISSELSAKKGSFDMLASQIPESAIALNEKNGSSELKLKSQNLNIEYKKLLEDYGLCETNISKLKPEKDKLQGIIETKDIDLKQLNNETERLKNKLNLEIESSEYNSVDEIMQIIEHELDIDKESKKIREFENKLFSHQKQLNILKQQAEGKVFDNSVYEQTNAEIGQIANSLAELNKKSGSGENELKELNAKLLIKTNIEKESEKLNMRAENIKTLKNLFKASGFVNYVSSVYLQNLVNIANQRFTLLTGQKLRLELTDTNDFIIRDFLNEGKTRSVKTLSGGQTFQASLSLALALADNIQSVTKSQHNFFFLDEGFGSLDRESLSVVFSSLKSLRKENRIVGVISHVEEMQQEIDNYLKVVNEAESGSKIHASWQ